MKKLALTALSVCAASLMIQGCATSNKKSPDEFAIVTKAPLVMPPDYSLKPPKPGETRPQEKSTSQRAQELLVGDATAEAPSVGELAFIQDAGALQADRSIRAVLGAENGGVGYKEASFTNRVLFWQVDGQGNIDDSGAPLRVDNADEWLAVRQKSIDAVTGGEQIIINKDGRTLKLPGVR